jgi:hypothetical protein
MKLFKVFAFMTVLMMTVGLLSCVKSGDSDTLESKWEEWLKEVQTEINASAGSYSGYLYYQSDQSENKLDSVDAVWNLNNDSTLDFQNVPIEVLVKHMPESQKDLQAAVSNAGRINIHVKLVYDYYYCSPLVMYVYPQYITFPVDYDGATRQVKISFRTSETTSDSYAKYMMKDDYGYVHKCLVGLYPESLYLDGKLQTQFTADSYLIWLGAKN